MTNISTQDDEDSHYFEIIINDSTVEICIDSDKWLEHSFDLKNLLNSVFLHPQININKKSIGVRLCDDAHIQDLNKTYRGIDKPTNVLSFPNDSDDYMGDIAIAIETLEREAIEQEKSFIHHFIHMLIHGILHLQGYDHMNETDAQEMESLEIKILADMQIKNPYI